MPTSGVSNFQVTTNQVIEAAFRLIGVYGTGETPSAADYTNATQALNIAIKSWQTKGILVWAVEEMLIPMVVGQNKYPLGPAGSYAFRPLRVTDAFIRNSSNVDLNLQILSRQEYLLFGLKNTQSIPTSCYYDQQLTNGQLYIFGANSDATRVIHLFFQRPIQDMVAGTDNFDFPQEWFQAIKWGLASELAPEYGVTGTQLQLIETKAQSYLSDMSDWSQEDVSTFFTPNNRSMNA